MQLGLYEEDKAPQTYSDVIFMASQEELHQCAKLALDKHPLPTFKSIQTEMHLVG
jgi:hypothetical protein